MSFAPTRSAAARAFALGALLFAFASVAAEAPTTKSRPGSTGDPIRAGRKFKGVWVHADESNASDDYVLEIMGRSVENITGIARNGKVPGVKNVAEGAGSAQNNIQIR